MLHNKRLLAWLALVSLCVLVLALLRASAGQGQPNDVPLVRLVAVPEKYHGKRVRIIGFVRLGFESNVIYPHKEDYQHALLGNGVWINVPTLTMQGMKNRNMKYCLIEGTFDAKNTGHLGMWSGSIKNIGRFEIWSDPAKPRL